MNSFIADAFFHIGTQHVRSGLPCEDYALTDATPAYAYAIVADGCSSGGKTDVGARILAHMTARAIGLEFGDGLENVTADVVFRRSTELWHEGRALLGITEQDMLSTLLTAFVSPAGGFVRIYGDGAVVRVYDDSRMQLSLFTWDGNMPYYPNYADGSTDAFITAHGGSLDAARVTEEHVVTDGVTQTCTTIRYALRDGMAGVTIPLDAEEITRLRALGVFSDGVTQVQQVPWVQVIQDMTAFRSMAGAFLKRRMLRQLKIYDHAGAEPYDDIAGAVLLRSYTKGETP